MTGRKLKQKKSHHGKLGDKSKTSFHLRRAFHQRDATSLESEAQRSYQITQQVDVYFLYPVLKHTISLAK